MRAAPQVSHLRPGAHGCRRSAREKAGTAGTFNIRPLLRRSQFMTNHLLEVMKLGQSIWYDNIRRAMLDGGDLQTKITDDDLRGVTSNPTIFEKAITGSTDYDE